MPRLDNVTAVRDLSSSGTGAGGVSFATMADNIARVFADAGATLFLMPADHCTEAAGHVPDGLTVAPVSTLAEAVEAIRAYTSGGTVPSCPVDAA